MRSWSKGAIIKSSPFAGRGNDLRPRGVVIPACRTKRTWLLRNRFITVKTADNGNTSSTPIDSTLKEKLDERRTDGKELQLVNAMT